MKHNIEKLLSLHRESSGFTIKRVQDAINKVRQDSDRNVPEIIKEIHKRNIAEIEFYLENREY